MYGATPKGRDLSRGPQLEDVQVVLVGAGPPATWWGLSVPDNARLCAPASVNLTVLTVSICAYVKLDIMDARLWSEINAIYVLCIYACLYVYALIVCTCL